MKTFASTAHDANSINGLGVFTLVLWVGCVLIGGLGFALHYAHPRPPQVQPPPVKVEMLEVKLAPDLPSLPDSSQKSTMTDPLAQPQIPQPIAVAQPSPAVAFALPVEGPVQVVAPRFAAHTQAPTAPAAGPAPTPQKLVFGEGEGRLPQPDYPERARKAGQQGTVGVRLIVAEDGHVADVQIIGPCPWPLLNNEGYHWGLKRCHFTPGSSHIYDIQLRFVLTN